MFSGMIARCDELSLNPGVQCVHSHELGPHRVRWMNHPVVHFTAHKELHMPEGLDFRFRPLQELKHPWTVLLKQLPSAQDSTELPSLIVLRFSEYSVTESTAIFHCVGWLVVLALHRHKQVR